MRVSTTHDELPNTNGRLTDVAVNMVLGIGIVGPKNPVDTSHHVLDLQPEAQEEDSSIPTSADKAR